MSSKYSIIRDGVTTIASLLKYDTVIDEQGVIYKDCGDYCQMVVPVYVKGSSVKDHNTYEVYYDDSGNIVRIYSHPTNSGPTGVIYP